MRPKKVVLKDGSEIILRPLQKKDTAAKLLKEYFNPLIKERVHLLYDRLFTLKEEKDWLASKKRLMAKGNFYYILAEYNGKAVGGVTAEKQPFKARGNVEIGIAISKKFRNKGLGKILLQEMIAKVKRGMKPINIYLTVSSANAQAIRVYEKIGFKRKFTYKKWLNHYGQYHDLHFMLLEK